MSSFNWLKKKRHFLTNHSAKLTLSYPVDIRVSFTPKIGSQVQKVKMVASLLIKLIRQVVVTGK